jgi:hypothetical protein
MKPRPAGSATRTPLVSICVPAYNGARFLRECLDSALAQTCADFEILVVDDSSGDNTAALARDYARRFPRVRVHVNERNLGLVANWNRCVELARGAWIKPLFQDDRLEPECLARMLAAARPGELLVVTRRTIDFERGVTPALRHAYEPFLSRHTLRGVFGGAARIDAPRFAANMVARPKVNCIGEPSTLLLHRSAFERFGGFNPALVNLAGWELAARVAVHAGISYVDESLVTIRVHAGSATQVRAASRRFRVQVLDGLIVEHDMASAPVYEPVRLAAAAQRPPVDLRLRLVESARRAKRRARRYAHDAFQPDVRAPLEWEDAERRYPLLTAMPARSRATPLAAIMHGVRWAFTRRAGRAATLVRPAMSARPS